MNRHKPHIRSPAPDDEGQYPVPTFTEEEHEAARAEGCLDAYDRWQWMTSTNRFVNSHERMHRTAKAMFRGDLESVGLPPEVLGAMSKAANKLPGSPDFEYPEEINVPSDPEIREACIDGMKERLQRLYGRLEEVGVSPDMHPESENVPLRHRDTVRNVHEEIARVERRLQAFGGGWPRATQAPPESAVEVDDVEEEAGSDDWDESWPGDTDPYAWG